VVNYSARFTIEGGSGAGAGAGTGTTVPINGTSPVGGSVSGIALMSDPAKFRALLASNQTLDANTTQVLRELVLKNYSCLTDGTNCPQSVQESSASMVASSAPMAVVAAIAALTSFLL
jgi:hypothetical protein